MQARRRGFIGLQIADWATYARLLRFTRPYLGRLALGLLFGLLYAGAHGGILWFIQKGLPNFFPKVPDQEIPWRVILLAVAGLVGAGLVRGIGQYVSGYMIRWVGARVVMDLRNAVFRRLNELSLSYFVSSRAGDLISRTTNDTLMAENAVSMVVEDLAKEPVTLLVSIGWLFWLDPWLATASLVLFPVCIIPVVLFGRRVRRFSREAQQRVADFVSILQELIAGVRIVKAFGMEGYENARFDQQNRGFFSRIMRVTRANLAVEPIIVFLTTCGVGLVLVYVRSRHMPVNDFLAYAAALFMMYTPVKKLSRVHLLIQQAVAAAERVFQVLDAPVDVVERPGAVPFTGHVESVAFDHVVFAYGGEPVLNGITFSVRAGQRVAIVGGSGAGKTTLVSLLPRFYDVQGGAVLINGRDTREFTLASLRRLIGLVTQDTVLFNDTVANNIAYGSPEADQESIVRAARRANAHDFIMRLPQQYATVIGDMGVRLSGGERQRLAIARALLRNPPILILDEATSALDTESERLVQAALQELMVNRTVFAIAHRLSTIANCDRIIVLDRGRIVEEGTHEQLLACGGLYKRLYDMQFADPAGAP